MNFGERLIQAREKLGFNQANFSEKIELAAQSLARYEKNKVNPSMEFVAKLTNMFNINSNWLLTGKGSMFISEDSRDSNTNIQNGDGNIAINGNITINTSDYNHSNDIKEIIELLHFAPSGFLTIIKDKLKSFKDMSQI